MLRMTEDSLRGPAFNQVSTAPQEVPGHSKTLLSAIRPPIIPSTMGGFFLWNRSGLGVLGRDWGLMTHPLRRD